MRKVNVGAYEIGLVFKDGDFKQLLLTGSYWFWKREKVMLFDITRQFLPPVDLDILLQDQTLADILQVVEVKEQEIVLRYQGGLLKEVLETGRHAFWKSLLPYRFERIDLSGIDIPAEIDPAVLQSALLKPFIRTAAVDAHEKALLFVNGRFEKLLEGGVYYWWKNAVSVQLVRVDSRQQSLEIAGQEILTGDKAGVRVNAWAQFRVGDARKAVLDNKDYDKQLYVFFQLALREYVGACTLDDLLAKKNSISDFVLQQVREKSAALGVEVLGFGIRDIILPGYMREILNQVLVAEKKAQANSIMRREETASTRSLLNTAKLMEENAMLWKLKEMEYVEKIAEKVSNISITGNGSAIDQLKEMLVTSKK